MKSIFLTPMDAKENRAFHDCRFDQETGGKPFFHAKGQILKTDREI